MPALAITDLANLFGVVKFYEAARGAGVKPIIGCDVWITQRAQSRRAVPRAAAVRRPRGLPPALRAGSRAPTPTNQYRGARRDAPRVARRGDRGPDRAVRRARRATSARRCCPAMPPRRARRRERWTRRFPGALLPRGAARRARRRRRARRTRRSRSPRGSGCRSSRRIRCSSCAPEDFRAHEARVCIAQGYVLGDSARARASSRPSQYFKTQARDGASSSPTCPRRSRTRRDRAPLHLTIHARQEPPAGLPDARRAYRSRTTCEREARRASSGASRQLYPRRRRARPQRAPLRRAPRVRDRRPSSRWASRATSSSSPTSSTGRRRNGVPVGPGPRLGRGLARRVLRSASPTSTRCATTCCSSASSIPSACRCPTSTSTSARTGATA